MSKARWRVALWSVMVLVVLMLVWHARGGLLPFALGAVLAYTLTPVVDRVAAVLPGRSPSTTVYRRGFAVLLIYLCVGAVLVALGTLLIPVMADQIAQFADRLPSLVDSTREQADRWLREYQTRVPPEAQDRINGYADDASNAAAQFAQATVRRSFEVLAGTLTIVFGFLVIPFWLFYALRDRHAVSRNFMNAVPPEVREDAGNVLAISDHVFGRYVRGQLLLAVVLGVAVGVVLTLMHIQLSIALGVFAGVMELIPILGPWLGAAPGLLIVAASEPEMLPWVALVYLIVQQLENHLLVPRIQGQAVEIHPAMVILLLVVGGASFGFLGLLLTVPVAAILREVFWYADRRLAGVTPAEAVARSSAGKRRAGMALPVDAVLEDTHITTPPIREDDALPPPPRPEPTPRAPERVG